MLLVGAPLLAQDENPIEVGDTLQGLLSTGERAVEYTFEGEQGLFITATMTQIDSMDPFLRLLDARGNLLTEDDDSAGSLNSRIGPYRLPSNGTYTLVATSLSGSDLGAFTLSLATATVRRIEYGQQITGELSADEPTLEFTFRANAGDAISLDLESTAFDAYLTLVAASPRTELFYDDDSGMDRNARIGPYLLTEEGDYNAVVSSFGEPSGEFTLTLNKVEADPIDFNAVENIQISGGQARYFSFEGEAGQVVDILVDSSNKLDTSLALINPTSFQVASAEDVNNQVDPSLTNVILTEDGTYFIAVQPNVSRDARTPVIVKLSESRLPAIDTVPQTIQFGDDFNQHLLVFEGNAGERVRLRFMIESREALSPNVRVTQGGQEIASISSYTISDEISFGIIVPQDGQVVIDLTDYNYAPATVTVELERE